MWRERLSKFSPRSFDWVLVGAVLLLMALGLAAIYSVDLSRDVTLNLFRKQFIAAVVGLTGLAVVSTFQPSWFRSSAKMVYAGAVLALVAVLIFGSEIRGTKGWFALPGFSFQPVEFAKAGVILILAAIAGKWGRRFDRIVFIFGTGFFIALPAGLVLLQPDLGSALLLVAIWFGMLWLAGVRLRYIGAIVAVGALAGVAAWFVYLNPLQKARLTTFIDPYADPTRNGYNVIQSMIAVGSGSWFGKGIGQGSQSQLRFLPEAQTDFIFSVIAEELGFVGAVATLVLFGVVLWRLTVIMARAADDFSALTVGGVALLFFIQGFVNIGAEIGILPLTGVTVPFVSYGGSSLVINLLLIGVVECMVPKKY